MYFRNNNLKSPGTKENENSDKEDLVGAEDLKGKNSNTEFKPI